MHINLLNLCHRNANKIGIERELKRKNKENVEVLNFARKSDSNKST